MAKSYPSYLVGQNHPDNRARVHPQLQKLWRKRRSISGREGLLSLIRDPDNPFDEGAVSVWLCEPWLCLGYLPSSHSWVGRAMDEGKPVSVWVAGIERKGFPFRRRYFVDLGLKVEWPNVSPRIYTSHFSTRTPRLMSLLSE